MLYLTGPYPPDGIPLEKPKGFKTRPIPRRLLASDQQREPLCHQRTSLSSIASGMRTQSRSAIPAIPPLAATSTQNSKFSLSPSASSIYLSSHTPHASASPTGKTRPPQLGRHTFAFPAVEETRRCSTAPRQIKIGC